MESEAPIAARNPQFTEIAGASLGRVESARLKSALAGIKNGAERAGVGAINKTLAKGRTLIVNDLTVFLNLKKKNLRKRTIVRKASLNRPGGAILIMGRPIGLVNFGAVDTNTSGVYATVVRGESPIQVRSGFIATGKFDNTHVFQREGRERLPIDSVFSQRLYDLFKRSPLPAKLTQWIPVEFKTQMNSQIQRFLGNRK